MNLTHAELQGVIAERLRQLSVSGWVTEADLIATRIEEDEAAKEANANTAPAPTANAAAKPVDTMPTSHPVLEYARKRTYRPDGSFTSSGRRWNEAAHSYIEDNPDDMIQILRDDLKREEARAAEAPKLQEECSGPARARGEATEKAQLIKALLWRIAEEYHPERVWGEELTEREVQRSFDANA